MFVIPTDQLPPGFAERIDSPPARPAPPRPAATVVLLREAAGGPEALLLRRHRRSGFVPGAYVFPGGRVDAADADPRLAAGLPGATGPEPAFLVAALREAFEETGVLLARDAAGRPLPDAVAEPRLAGWREALLADRATLPEALAALDAALAAEEVVHCAHWITPIAEPRRYDTHFFLARVPEGCTVEADPREMTEAVWLTPREALARFRAGTMKMVFPTVATLESVEGFATVAEALDHFRGRRVEPVLPRLVRTAGGVGIVLEAER